MKIGEGGGGKGVMLPPSTAVFLKKLIKLVKTDDKRINRARDASFVGLTGHQAMEMLRGAVALTQTISSKDGASTLSMGREDYIEARRELASLLEDIEQAGDLAGDEETDHEQEDETMFSTDSEESEVEVVKKTRKKTPPVKLRESEPGSGPDRSVLRESEAGSRLSRPVKKTKHRNRECKSPYRVRAPGEGCGGRGADSPGPSSAPQTPGRGLGKGKGGYYRIQTPTSDPDSSGDTSPGAKTSKAVKRKSAASTGAGGRGSPRRMRKFSADNDRSRSVPGLESEEEEFDLCMDLEVIVFVFVIYLKSLFYNHQMTFSIKGGPARRDHRVQLRLFYQRQVDLGEGDQYI